MDSSKINLIKSKTIVRKMLNNLITLKLIIWTNKLSNKFIQCY
uniref:Uncharacterized protein n=1 Tax=Meloidogyne enterolobii TaxID=390850 RepID=A0A6V7UCY4_MELEN|nr:unnamed protein product [Meloidogyne enterolobii]